MVADIGEDLGSIRIYESGHITYICHWKSLSMNLLRGVMYADVKGYLAMIRPDTSRDLGIQDANKFNDCGLHPHAPYSLLHN